MAAEAAEDAAAAAADDVDAAALELAAMEEWLRFGNPNHRITQKKTKRERDNILIAKLKLNNRVHPDELYRYNIIPELEIAKQGDTAEARECRSKIDHDKEVLMLEPIELERIRGRKIVKVKDYLLAYPTLLPKKIDPNGLKKNKKRG